MKLFLCSPSNTFQVQVEFKDYNPFSSLKILKDPFIYIILNILGMKPLTKKIFPLKKYISDILVLSLIHI